MDGEPLLDEGFGFYGFYLSLRLKDKYQVFREELAKTM